MCNHPDLFEGRPIVSAFDTAGIQVQLPTAAVRALERDVWGAVDLAGLSLLPAGNERMARWEAECIQVCPSPTHHFECQLVPEVLSQYLLAFEPVLRFL